MPGCYACGGTGECPICHGSGLTLTSKCVACDGKGGCSQCNPNGHVARESRGIGYEWIRVARIVGFIIAAFLYYVIREWLRDR